MKHLSDEEKAGLMTTVIAHLAVLIVLLVAGLGVSLKDENSFVLDFTKYEELERMRAEAERLQKEAEFQQAISDKLQKEIGNSPSVRNVTVDRASLKDDKGIDAEQLYKDAERLQKELSAGFNAPEDDYADIAPEEKKNDSKTEERQYSGPSVVSYSLEGRKASKLSIPAYRCMGAGEVTVLISVNPSGTVIAARVDETCSSTDGCLQAYAVRAARVSKFSASATAPAKQDGNIVYQFIAQ